MRAVDLDLIKMPYLPVAFGFLGNIDERRIEQRGESPAAMGASSTRSRPSSSFAYDASALPKLARALADTKRARVIHMFPPRALCDRSKRLTSNDLCAT